MVNRVSSLRESLGSQQLITRLCHLAPAQVTSQIMLVREATWMPLDLRWAAYAVFVAGLVLSALLYVALHVCGFGW